MTGIFSSWSDGVMLICAESRRNTNRNKVHEQLTSPVATCCHVPPLQAIICTTVIGHNDELYDPYFAKSGGWDHEVYFATVWRSTFTLFQIMTLDQWNPVVFT